VTLLETGPWLPPSISAGGRQVQANPDGSCPMSATGQQQANDQSNTNEANRGAVLRPDAVSTNYYAGQSRSQFFNLAAFSPTPVGAELQSHAALRRRCMLALKLLSPMC